MVIESPYPEFSPELAADLYGDEGPPAVGLDHAAVVETALMMHVNPRLVRADLIADDASPALPGYDLLPIPEGFTSASGVLSRTVGATPSSARAFEEITTYLRGLIEEALFSDSVSYMQTPGGNGRGPA